MEDERMLIKRAFDSDYTFYALIWINGVVLGVGIGLAL